MLAFAAATSSYSVSSLLSWNPTSTRAIDATVEPINIGVSSVSMSKCVVFTNNKVAYP